jgi:hypothetical protein
MKRQRFSKTLLYACLAIFCPLVAFSGTLAYQSVANSDFWQSITPDESAAGAMMAFAEFTQLVFFTLIGCFVGLIFAVMSVWLWFEQRALRKLVDE